MDNLQNNQSNQIHQQKQMLHKPLKKLLPNKIHQLPVNPILQLIRLQTPKNENLNQTVQQMKMI